MIYLCHWDKRLLILYQYSQNHIFSLSVKKFMFTKSHSFWCAGNQICCILVCILLYLVKFCDCVCAFVPISQLMELLFSYY